MNARIDNPESCVVCARRSDGLAVGLGKSKRKPQKLGWFCLECGPGLARKALSMSRNMDAVEQRACMAVAAEAGDGDLTIPANELPAFIAWCVKSFAEQMRRDMENEGVPF